MAYLRSSPVAKMRICYRSQLLAATEHKLPYLMACSKRFGKHNTQVAIPTTLLASQEP